MRVERIGLERRQHRTHLRTLGRHRAVFCEPIRKARPDRHLRAQGPDIAIANPLHRDDRRLQEGPHHGDGSRVCVAAPDERHEHVSAILLDAIHERRAFLGGASQERVRRRQGLRRSYGKPGVHPQQEPSHEASFTAA